eukprot:TRINITY_DN8141_c0_g1_i1.p1 TRINITY_DN8141_c0_g1~~TRINITY_DN8141_c0_g1_i1.p1  ORF type:complete len:2763 (+),score=858.44 TRINITY_DN8141_c0_g1_i1:738-8291(+)
MAADYESTLTGHFLDEPEPGESDAIICKVKLHEHPDNVIRRAGLIVQTAMLGKRQLFYDVRQQRWRYYAKSTSYEKKIKSDKTLRSTRKDYPPAGILRIVGGVDFKNLAAVDVDQDQGNTGVIDQLKALGPTIEGRLRRQRASRGGPRPKVKSKKKGVASAVKSIKSTGPDVTARRSAQLTGYEDAIDSDDALVDAQQELTRLAEAGDTEFMTPHEECNHVRQYLNRAIPAVAVDEKLVVVHSGTGDVAHQLAKGMRTLHGVRGDTSDIVVDEADEKEGGRHFAAGALVGVNPAVDWHLLKREFTHQVLIDGEDPGTLRVAEFVDRLIESLADGHVNTDQTEKEQKTQSAPKSENVLQVPTRKPVAAVATVLVGGNPLTTPYELQQSVSRGYPILIIEGSGGYANELCTVLDELHHYNPLAQQDDLKMKFLHGGPLDPMTERILSSSKLRPIKRGTPLEEFKRQLVMCLKGDDTLHKAWVRYAQWQMAADGHKLVYVANNRLQVTLSVLATFSSVLLTFLLLVWAEYGCGCSSYSQIPPWNGVRGSTTTTTPKIPEDWWARDEWDTGDDWGPGGIPGDQRFWYLLYNALQWMVIAIPILMSLTQALYNQINPAESWVQFRTAYEEALKNIYMYRTGTGLYSDREIRRHSPKSDVEDKPDDGLVYSTRGELLSLTLCARQTTISTIIPGNRIAPWEGPIPPPNIRENHDDGFSDLTPDRYLEVRLKTKRDDYHKNSDDMEHEIKRVNYSVLMMSALGSLLAAIAALGLGVLQAWIAFTTCVVSQLQRYLEFSNLEQLQAEFNKADSRLSNVELWFAQLGQKKDNGDNIDRLVGDCEKVIFEEVNMWANRLTSRAAKNTDLDDAEGDEKALRKKDEEEQEAETTRKMRHLGYEALTKNNIQKAMENRTGPEAKALKQALVRINDEVQLRPTAEKNAKQDIWVTSPEWPVIAGHYLAHEGVTVNSYSVWVCGDQRVYTNDAGRWAITQDAATMQEGGSLAETHNTHGPDELPHHCKWKVMVDRNLYPYHTTKVSDRCDLRSEFWVNCLSRPDATGMYIIDTKAAELNGWPVWAKQDMRLFSNRSGHWMLSLTYGAMIDDRGWAQTDVPHGGVPPTSGNLGWDLYIGRMWQGARTRFVHETEPLTGVEKAAQLAEPAEQGDAKARKERSVALKDITSFLLSVPGVPRSFASQLSSQHARMLFSHFQEPEGMPHEGLAPRDARMATHQRLVDLVRSAPLGDTAEVLAELPTESFLESLKALLLFEIVGCMFRGLSTRAMQPWCSSYYHGKAGPPELSTVLQTADLVEDFVAEMQTIFGKLLQGSFREVKKGDSAALPNTELVMTQVRDEQIRSALQRISRPNREALFHRVFSLFYLLEMSRIGALDGDTPAPKCMSMLARLCERPVDQDTRVVAEFCMLGELWMNVSQQLADLDIDAALEDDMERAVLVRRLLELRRSAGTSLETMERPELLERLPPKFRKLMRKRSVAQICSSIQRLLSGTPASRVVDTLLSLLDQPDQIPGLRNMPLFEDPTLSERFIVAAEALHQREINTADRGVLVRRLRVHPSYCGEIDAQLALMEDAHLCKVLSVIQATFANSYAGRLIDRLTDELVSLDLKALLPIEDREKFAQRAREFHDMPSTSFKDISMPKGSHGHIPFTLVGTKNCVVEKVEFAAHSAGLRVGMHVVRVGRDADAVQAVSARKVMEALARPGNEILLRIDMMQGEDGKRHLLNVLCFGSLRQRLQHLTVEQLQEVVSTTVWLMNAQLQRRIWDRLKDLPHLRPTDVEGGGRMRFDLAMLSDEAVDRLFRYAEHCRIGSIGGVGPNSVFLKDLEGRTVDSPYLKSVSQAAHVGMASTWSESRSASDMILQRIGDSVLSSAMMDCEPGLILNMIKTMNSTLGDQIVMNMFETVLSGLQASNWVALAVKFQNLFLVCTEQPGAGLEGTLQSPTLRRPAVAAKAQDKFHAWVLQSRMRRDALMRALSSICIEEVQAVTEWTYGELRQTLEASLQVNPDPDGDERMPAMLSAQKFFEAVDEGLPDERVPGIAPGELFELVKRLLSEVTSTLPYRIFIRIASSIMMFDLREMFVQVDLRYRLVYLIDDLVESGVIDLHRCVVVDPSVQYDDDSSNEAVAKLKEELKAASGSCANTKRIPAAENWPDDLVFATGHDAVLTRGEEGEVLSIVRNSHGLHYAVRLGRRVNTGWEGSGHLVLSSPEGVALAVPPKRFFVSMTMKRLSALGVDGVITCLRGLRRPQLEELVRTSVGVLCQEWGGTPAGAFFRAHQFKLRELATSEAKQPRKPTPRGGRTQQSTQSNRPSSAGSKPAPPAKKAAAATPTPTTATRRPSTANPVSAAAAEAAEGWTTAAGAVILTQKRTILQAVGVLKSKMRNRYGRQAVLRAFLNFDAAACCAESTVDRMKRVQLLIEDEDVVNTIVDMQKSELKRLFSHLDFMNAAPTGRADLKQRCAQQREEAEFFGMKLDDDDFSVYDDEEEMGEDPEIDERCAFDMTLAQHPGNVSPGR